MIDVPLILLWFFHCPPIQMTNDNDVMKQYVLGSMDNISRIHGKKTDDILKTMPDSPSISAVSNLSNVIPMAPIAAPAESLLLASDASIRSKSRGRKRRKGKMSSKGHQSRASAEQLPLNGDLSGHHNNQYDMEQLIRYDDPPPKHASKKYDGFVPKAVSRMDTTGHLPTPSVSDQSKLESPAHTNSAFTFVVQQQDYHSENLQVPSSGGLPRPPPPVPPPIPTDYVDINLRTIHNGNEPFNEDIHLHPDHDEDESLKRLAEAAGYALPYEAPVIEDRDRGFSGYSQTAYSQTTATTMPSMTVDTPHSASSGIASSLNSNDSSEMSQMSSLERPTNKNKKKKERLVMEHVIETEYNPNEPLVSVSSSAANSTNLSTTLTENELDLISRDSREIGAIKKTKKKKKVKKPKVKSPFFDSDAAISKSAKTPKSTKSAKTPKSTKSMKASKSPKSMKSSKSPKSLKSSKSPRSLKSKSKLDAKEKAKLKSRPLPKTPKLKVPSKSKSSDGRTPTPTKSPTPSKSPSSKSSKKSKSLKVSKSPKSTKSSKSPKSAKSTDKSKTKGKGKKKGSSRQLPT